METDTIPTQSERARLAADATVPDPPFINPEGLAIRWSMDKKTVLAGIARKDIPCTKIGRRWLIPLAWVEAREAAEDGAA
jgi:hypothetical protein